MSHESFQTIQLRLFRKLINLTAIGLIDNTNFRKQAKFFEKGLLSEEQKELFCFGPPLSWLIFFYAH